MDWGYLPTNIRFAYGLLEYTEEIWDADKETPAGKLE